jgi:HEAT repeat protein
LGADAKEAVPELAKALTDKDRWVRLRAMDALTAIGPGAAKAVPQLIKALDDEEMRRDAISTLGRIGPAAKEAIPALERVRDKELFHEHSARAALEAIRKPE